MPLISTYVAVPIQPGDVSSDILSRYGSVPAAMRTSAGLAPIPLPLVEHARATPLLRARSFGALFSPNRRFCSPRNHKARRKRAVCGATPPSPASNTRPARTPPWPPQNSAPPTSGHHVLGPTSPAPLPPARWNDGTSVQPADPATDAPTAANPQGSPSSLKQTHKQADSKSAATTPSATTIRFQAWTGNPPPPWLPVRVWSPPGAGWWPNPWPLGAGGNHHRLGQPHPGIRESIDDIPLAQPPDALHEGRAVAVDAVRRHPAEGQTALHCFLHHFHGQLRFGTEHHRLRHAGFFRRG